MSILLCACIGLMHIWALYWNAVVPEHISQISIVPAWCRLFQFWCPRPWFAKNALQIIQPDTYGVCLIDQHPHTSNLLVRQAIAVESCHFLYTWSALGIVNVSSAAPCKTTCNASTCWESRNAVRPLQNKPTRSFTQKDLDLGQEATLRALVAGKDHQSQRITIKLFSLGKYHRWTSITSSQRPRDCLWVAPMCTNASQLRWTAFNVQPCISQKSSRPTGREVRSCLVFYSLLHMHMHRFSTPFAIFRFNRSRQTFVELATSLHVA